jgi:hypothetical protein
VLILVKRAIKKDKITLVLVIFLVMAIGYILVDKYMDAKQREQLGIYQQGLQKGYEQAIIQLMQQASTCQQVPIYVENQTLSLIAVNCLQRTN